LDAVIVKLEAKLQEVPIVVERLLTEDWKMRKFVFTSVEKTENVG
jgi:hypothetical protein